MDTGHLVRPEDLASSTINNSTLTCLAINRNTALGSWSNRRSFQAGLSNGPASNSNGVIQAHKDGIWTKLSLLSRRLNIIASFNQNIPYDINPTSKPSHGQSLEFTPPKAPIYLAVEKSILQLFENEKLLC